MPSLSIRHVLATGVRGHRGWPLALVGLLTCLVSCSDDDFAAPDTPVAYRLTLHTSEPKRPTRVLSAPIDWRQGRFLSGMSGVDLSAPMTKAGDTWTVSFAGRTELPFTSMLIGDDVHAALDSLVVSDLALRPTSAGCAAPSYAGASSPAEPRPWGGDVARRKVSAGFKARAAFSFRRVRRRGRRCRPPHARTSSRESRCWRPLLPSQRLRRRCCTPQGASRWLQDRCRSVIELSHEAQRHGAAGAAFCGGDRSRTGANGRRPGCHGVAGAGTWDEDGVSELAFGDFRTGCARVRPRLSVMGRGRALVLCHARPVVAGDNGWPALETAFQGRQLQMTIPAA